MTLFVGQILDSKWTLFWATERIDNTSFVKLLAIALPFLGN
jgi:hypothetical protein